MERGVATLERKPSKRGIVICLAAAVLFMSLSGIYFYATGQRFITAMSPQTETDHILLIIDPGHGGADGGAVSITGVNESEINLAIALRLEALAALYGLPTEMTRRTEDIDYPEDANTIRAKKVADTRARVTLINEASNAVVISIHQNTYAGASVSGPQVLFARTDASEAFAVNMQDALTQSLGLERPRTPVKVPQGVYLMNHIDVPAILVECGFLSNPQEESLLRTEVYQLRLASALLAGYVQSLELLQARYFG